LHCRENNISRFFYNRTTAVLKCKFSKRLLFELTIKK
jgi:hypothetical protein